MSPIFAALAAPPKGFFLTAAEAVPEPEGFALWLASGGAPPGGLPPDAAVAADGEALSERPIAPEAELDSLRSETSPEAALAALWLAGPMALDSPPPRIRVEHHEAGPTGLEGPSPVGSGPVSALDAGRIFKGIREGILPASQPAAQPAVEAEQIFKGIREGILPPAQPAAEPEQIFQGIREGILPEAQPAAEAEKIFKGIRDGILPEAQPAVETETIFKGIRDGILPADQPAIDAETSFMGIREGILPAAQPAAEPEQIFQGIRELHGADAPRLNGDGQSSEPSRTGRFSLTDPRIVPSPVRMPSAAPDTVQAAGDGSDPAQPAFIFSSSSAMPSGSAAKLEEAPTQMSPSPLSPPRADERMTQQSGPGPIIHRGDDPPSASDPDVRPAETVEKDVQMAEAPSEPVKTESMDSEPSSSSQDQADGGQSGHEAPGREPQAHEAPAGSARRPEPRSAETAEPGPAEALGRDRLEAMRRTADIIEARRPQRLSMEVDRPGLGPIRMDIRHDQAREAMEVAFEARLPEAREAIQAGQGELRRSLEDRGLQLTRFDVQADSGSGQHPADSRQSSRESRSDSRPSPLAPQSEPKTERTLRQTRHSGLEVIA